MKAWSKRAAQVGLALALVLASGVAAALGLGQLELKSKLGEPLLAEIPIISNDPAELRQLRAGLASPETFARIGLEPPDQVVANLRFVSALDAQGNPVIRVTSSQPITQPLLTFLVEVDWGQGRLVREYSVLLDTPRTVAAPLQPPIQAPTAAPSNAIVREPAVEAPVAPEPVPTAEPSAESESESSPDPAAVAGQPAAAEPAPTDAIATAPVAAPPPQPRPRPTQYGEVQRGETLSEIADQLDLGVSLDQAMIALLRANPEAFIGGNVNLLKQGVVLRLPDREELAAVDAIQASALVRSQTRQWRQARQAAVPQPVAAADATSDGAAGEAAQAGDAGDATPASGARLEIIPPGASDASEAGTQSGIAAGGEGDMQRELATTKETLAAREAELAEMKSRVAALEELQSKQQQLLEMKDSELAAVQQRLAQSNQDADVAGASAMPWLVGGVVLLLLALLVGWWLGRRGRAPAFRAPRQDDARTRKSPLSDAFAPAAAPVSTSFGTTTSTDAATPATAASEAPADPVADTAPPPVQEAPPAGPSGQERPFPAPGEHPPQPSKRSPTWHQDAAAPAAGMASSIPTADVPAQERLELARAYIDLGDHDSARQLLREVAGNGDVPARQQAERMLRELE